ncbi:hypothetical protein [Peribacillus loiseleuriae]|uniref:Uncharacterized protein n=1 Tax=Peribacillus loiseleuriae TaxID=1679170 RepID=A0A0K9GUA4_9BACI|nr:hypothetical protein [Peribacillus loiseleuriae]KMY50203.1 hypothetical protein AC625_12395 [Peribacillus loiseleuriae]
MYLNMMSMDNEIFWGTLLIIISLIMGSLAWVVFSSLIRNNKKKRYIYLLLLLGVAVISLKNVFNYSSIVGWIVVFIYFIIPLTDFIFRHARKRELN